MRPNHNDFGSRRIQKSSQSSPLLFECRQACLALKRLIRTVTHDDDVGGSSQKIISETFEPIFLTPKYGPRNSSDIVATPTEIAELNLAFRVSRRYERFKIIVRLLPLDPGSTDPRHSIPIKKLKSCLFGSQRSFNFNRFRLVPGNLISPRRSDSNTSQRDRRFPLRVVTCDPPEIIVVGRIFSTLPTGIGSQSHGSVSMLITQPCGQCSRAIVVVFRSDHDLILPRP